MTHIGKEVNSLRKWEGDVGVKAKTLVKKWKQLLPDADSPQKKTTRNDIRTSYNSQSELDSSQDSSRDFVESQVADEEMHRTHKSSRHLSKHGKERSSHKHRPEENGSHAKANRSQTLDSKELSSRLHKDSSKRGTSSRLTVERSSRSPSGWDISEDRRNGPSPSRSKSSNREVSRLAVERNREHSPSLAGTSLRLTVERSREDSRSPVGTLEDTRGSSPSATRKRKG